MHLWLTFHEIPHLLHLDMSSHCAMRRNTHAGHICLYLHTVFKWRCVREGSRVSLVTHLSGCKVHRNMLAHGSINQNTSSTVFIRVSILSQDKTQIIFLIQDSAQPPTSLDFSLQEDLRGKLGKQVRPIETTPFILQDLKALLLMSSCLIPSELQWNSCFNMFRLFWMCMETNTISGMRFYC